MIELPYCSVVIPAFNEERYINDCLSALTQQTYPKQKFEIIVVDNGSKDQTSQIAERYADQVITLPDVNVGAVRNYGAKNSTGEVIIFLDSDCIVDTDWLYRAVNIYMKDPQSVYGGIYSCRKNPSWIEKYWFLETGSDRVLENNLLGGCIVISHKIFNDVGGFRESMSSGEDSALTKDLRNAGVNVEILPQLKVIHLGNPITIADFVNRQSWHAESYFSDPKKNLSDPVFWLVIIYPTIIFFSLFFSTFASSFFLMIFGTQLPPAILSLKRITRSGYRPTPYEALKILVLDNLYIIGRVKGIYNSLINKPRY